MKRVHVIAIALLSGFVMGLAVPAKAATYGAGISHTSVSVESVDQDECTITVSTGDDFEFEDCEDTENFAAGDLVTLEQDRDQGFVSIIAENGSEALLVR